MHKLAQYEIAEKIYDGDTTAIYRAKKKVTGKPVVLKFLKSDYPGNELLSDFTREYSITSSFHSERIVKAYDLEKCENSLVMVLEDCGFVSLASIISTVKKKLGWAIDISIQLTKILIEIHQKDIIHQDLNPSNILYNSEKQTVKIIDFGKAIYDPGNGIPSTGTNILKTNLHYISPEQTGRYDKVLDYRTDLYSLGVTLYQLFTGELPFVSEDPMELIHLHLATPPDPLTEHDPAFPTPLSNIVLKLLEKPMDDRYQTCTGLLADLNRCKDEWQRHQSISDFAVGEKDFRGKLVFPKTLFNRQSALTLLRDAVLNKTDESPSVTVITGYSGIGKTSLVNEFVHSLPAHSCHFLPGKYDLAVQEKPYAALSEIMQTLVNSVLIKNDESIKTWKKKIEKVVLESGQVLIDVTPELEIILGKQPPPPLLSPYETEQRLSRLCINFIQLFARKHKPLIIFLDDIHRADRAALKLIKQLTTSNILRNVAFIFCYRDNEVDEKHPLTPILNYIDKENTSYTTIHLPPLECEDISQLLSIILSKPEKQVRQLADICSKKTGGNPFFLKQFIHSLNSSGYLQFHRKRGGWNWDILAVNRAELTENIADLLIQRIQTLSDQSALLLKNAACIGKRFPLKTLAATVDSPSEDVWNHLHDLLSEGLLIADDQAVDQSQHESQILFGHDQIQQVAYSLLSQQQKQQTHLKIGQYLQKTTDLTHSNQNEFDIVNHLNRGVAYINSPGEILALIIANMKAGKRAKQSASYGAAHSFYQIGLQLLQKDCWQTDYDLTLKIHTDGCEAAYLNNEHDEMERLFKLVCRKARSVLERAKVYHIKIRSQKSSYKLAESVATCEEILNMLGVTLPKSPSRIFAMLKLIQTRIFMHGRKVKDMLDLPEMTNPYKKEAMKFLVEIATAVYYVKPKLLPFIALKAVRLSLKYGNTISAGQLGYPTYGFLLCGIPGGNIDKGYDYGQLSLNLQKQLNHNKIDPTTLYLVNNLIIHWKDHIRETLTPLLTAFKECTENGDFEHAANAAYSYSYRLYYIGYNLNRTEQELNLYRTEIEKHDQHIALCRQSLYCQAVANLLHANDNPELFSGEFYDEHEMVPIHESAKDHTTLFQLYLLKMIHCYLFHHYDEALIFSNMARKLLYSVLASVFVPLYHFYDSLVCLAVYHKTPGRAQLKCNFRIKINQRKMKDWASHSPQNYMNKYELVEAERARVKGNCIQAMNLYDSAIEQSRSNGYLQEEALAFELASRFYSSLNKVHLARPYRREARYCYYRWGAMAKVAHLDTLHTNESAAVPAKNSSPNVIPQTFIPREGGSRFDMLTVVKASRILTAETTFHELLKKIMKIMLESSGAQRGVLVFRENDSWNIKVVGTTRKKKVELLEYSIHEPQNMACVAIINYAIRTKGDVVLNDATREGMFTDDNYILENSPRSILCSPLIHQEEIVCVLYLENNLTTRAFSPERLELLRLLGHQAAINLRNSRLFSELVNSVADLHLEIKKRKDVQLQLLHAEKLSALGRLSSSIAHEFGNPLMGVKYLLSDLIERPNLSQEDQTLLSLGIKECDRMKKLLRDLGRLNRPTSGEKTYVNIQTLMDNVLMIQNKYLTSQRLQIVTRYHKQLPDIFIIQDQISQVLLNLTMNAADAIPKSGGTITITTGITEKTLFLSIADTGKGIDEQIQDNIFEPFFSTKREEDGTGLGLSISYGIIKQHKGQLTFVSRPGKGTTFTVTLPLIE